jgi:tRNA A-37 threonylcarbamoyl transferase component Bud32
LSAETLTPKVEDNIWAAFKAIHGLGVVHGDIREANILVQKDETVWIIDFEMSTHDGVTPEDVRKENAWIEYMLQQLKNEKSEAAKDAGEHFVTAIKLVEDLKEVGRGDAEIPDIARAGTPIIPGKTPEGTDGEEEDSDSSDTDSTW